ncbi:MAG TPA: hypothetical protein VGK48_15605 [Terriglobia bacterium]
MSANLISPGSEVPGPPHPESGQTSRVPGMKYAGMGADGLMDTASKDGMSF